MMKAQGQNDAPSAFRLSERQYRFYKKRKGEPNYSDVIDFCNIENNSPENLQQIQLESDNNQESTLPKIYSLRNKPGFYFIPQALSIEDQAHWVHQCVSKYPAPPNHTNLGFLSPDIW